MLYQLTVINFGKGREDVRHMSHLGGGLVQCLARRNVTYAIYLDMSHPYHTTVTQA